MDHFDDFDDFLVIFNDRTTENSNGLIGSVLAY